MADYVCGFMMNETEVILIHKTHPPEQAGSWNGIGGRIRKGEAPIDAMQREWAEETGDPVKHKWIEFARIKFKHCVVYFFTAFEHNMPALMQMTDEEVDVFPIGELNNHDLVEHVDWLVLLAKNHRALNLPVLIRSADGGKYESLVPVVQGFDPADAAFDLSHSDSVGSEAGAGDGGSD